MVVFAVVFCNVCSKEEEDDEGEDGSAFFITVGVTSADILFVSIVVIFGVVTVVVLVASITAVAVIFGIDLSFILLVVNDPPRRRRRYLL